MKQEDEFVEVTFRVGKEVADHLQWLGHEATNLNLMAYALRHEAERLAGRNDTKCLQCLLNATLVEDAVQEYVKAKLWMGYLLHHPKEYA